LRQTRLLLGGIGPLGPLLSHLAMLSGHMLALPDQLALTPPSRDPTS
jgi:hypothetical protein